MKRQLIDGSQALREAIEKSGHEYRVIGTQRHGREILMVRVGGTSESLQPALIACGAHTDEQATIMASLELMERIESERPVYIIPCRDPLGFDGMRRCMQLELGTDKELGDWEHLQQTLAENGEVLYHKDDLMIANLGEMVFAVYPSRENAATYFCENLWPKVKEEAPELVDRAKYRRFVLPADRLYFEEWDVFGPATATRYILDTGKLRCPDSVIGTIPPPLPFAVEEILAAIDEIKPGYDIGSARRRLGRLLYVCRFPLHRDGDQNGSRYVRGCRRGRQQGDLSRRAHCLLD